MPEVTLCNNCKGMYRIWLKTAGKPLLFAIPEQTIFDLVGDPQDVVQIQNNFTQLLTYTKGNFFSLLIIDTQKYFFHSTLIIMVH